MAQTGFPAPKDANEVEKVMRECHKEILHVFQLQPMDTADTLLSKHLITEELYGKLLSVPDSDTNKARQMVLNVKMKIKNNPQDFIYFLEVLRNNDAARSLVTKLEKSVISLQPSILVAEDSSTSKCMDTLSAATSLSEMSNELPESGTEESRLDSDSKKVALYILNKKAIDRKTAHIMIIGYPGNGKTHLLENLLAEDKLLEQTKDNFPSTDISASMVVVDVAGDNATSHSTVIGHGLSWKKIDSFKSMMMQVQQCDKLTIPDGKQLPLKEQVPLDVMPRYSQASAFEPTASLQDNISKVMELNDMSFEDLESTYSLYIRDTGGQVEFQEVLSILINGPSIFFFVIKANLSLDEPLTLEYRKGKDVINRYESATTTRQALVQALTTIQNTAKPTDIATHDSVVFIIGTHIDKIEPPEFKKEKIRKLNAELHNLIASHKFDDFIEYKNKESKQVLFRVSNTDTKPKYFKAIQKRVNKKIEGTNAFKNPYPLGYLLFSLELRHCKDDVVSRTKCEEIAAKFQIRGNQEVTEMLKFLHHKIGIIQYYDTEDLKHLIIKEPQVLFNKLTELMVKTFLSTEALLPRTASDLNKGIIKASELEQLFTEVSTMKPKEFISFLEHLRIAASFYEKDEKYFFIPSVINHLPERSLGKEAKSIICPLSITFKSSCCPKGVFGMTVCHFMSKVKNENLTFSLEKESIYKDLVCLKVYSSNEPQGKVFLRIQNFKEQSAMSRLPCQFPSTHIEVRFCPDEHEDFKTLAPLCDKIRTTLMKGIENSITRLNYDKDHVGAVESLKCHSCQKLHEKETKTGKVSVSCRRRLYPDNCCSCWFNQVSSKQQSGWKWFSVAVPILAIFSYIFIMWLLPNISPLTTSSTLNSKPRIKDLLFKTCGSEELEIITEVAATCNTFGYLLNLDIPTVKIEWDVPGKDPHSRCQNIMLRWLDGKGTKGKDGKPVTWKTLIKALQEFGKPLLTDTLENCIK